LISRKRRPTIKLDLKKISISFSYLVRQGTRAQNALGAVKFMFPNKYDIYLHDTPSKSLFNREAGLSATGASG
jgi:murein L,D-transpeptidase YcbB/YkuD